MPGKAIKKPVSQAQRKAMHAAAAGRSTIGIPQNVGAEFSAGDQPGKLPARAKSAKEVRPQSKAKEKVSPRPSRPQTRPARGRGL